MEAVARQADVARMTVYYHFGSRRGLLEALFDDLAVRGGLAEHLAAAFQRPDPLDALDGLIAAFVGFWAADRLVMRRLRSLARPLVPPEALPVPPEELPARPEGLRDVADLLFTLTSFETFDSLAADARTPEEVTRLLQRLARTVLTWDQPPGA